MSEPLRQGLRSIFAGVRFRTTAAAVTVVAAVLAGSVLVVGWVAQARLEEAITASAQTRAADLAALAEAGGAQGVLSGRGGDLFAQVVDTDGRMVAFSPGLAEFAPIVGDRPGSGEVRVLRIGELFEEFETDEVEDEGPYVVVARGALSAGSPVTILVGASLDPAEQALGVLQPLLWAGLPVVLAIVAALVWWLTGRALRPVEAMRARAATISAGSLDRRLPAPESRDEVFRLATTLNELLARLEASSAQTRRFVGDASHEMKTPVAAIRTMIEVAQRDPQFAEWQTLLSDVARENLRSEELLRDLLALAEADEGAAPARRVDVDLDQIAGRQARQTLLPDGVEIDTTGLAAARVRGDPEALARMIRNLLDNAARHAAHSVSLVTRVEDGAAVVEVSDDGAGIPVEDRQRVFDRFVRLDAGRARDTGGTGLGLSVVRAVARRHGGEARFVDARHGGATVEVRIPIEG